MNMLDSGGSIATMIGDHGVGPLLSAYVADDRAAIHRAAMSIKSASQIVL
ncbi:MAG: hypothetical protein K8F35_03540 [Dokdonella sp.]|nr:hypothetical protein [Dokdonella sp.]MBZ0222080.1 hypothetical protein [Dokdonella sp.]